MLKLPPAVIRDPLQRIARDCPDRIGEYLTLNAPLDEKGRYQHFDKLRFRIPEGLDHVLVWSLVKLARERQLSDVVALGDPVHRCQLLLTPAIYAATSECDRHTTAAALEWMSSKIGEQKHVTYLLNDLIEDEAISSSQLEGASTTTRVAKDLLKRQRAPRTPDEKMILGNYRMMQFVWDNRARPLSADLIAEIHQVGVENIDDEHYYPGVFRANDEVVVQDGDGNVVHSPPPAKGLEARLEALAAWANSNHSAFKSNNYLHPLIKAIVLHFAIGYEHPFRDGNGRVARSLFYWFMFKHDFAAFRYIAISTLLKAAPVQYGKSYLYTETDDMDLTYFVDYQSRTIIRGIADFKEAYEKTLADMNAFNRFLFDSGLYAQLNDKQKTVLQVASDDKSMQFTAVNLKESLGCSYNTAASVLNGLVDLGLFHKRKDGREWVFSLAPTALAIGR